MTTNLLEKLHTLGLRDDEIDECWKDYEEIYDLLHEPITQDERGNDIVT